MAGQEFAKGDHVTFLIGRWKNKRRSGVVTGTHRDIDGRVTYLVRGNNDRHYAFYADELTRDQPDGTDPNDIWQDVYHEPRE